jgi:hypothetical protein
MSGSTRRWPALCLPAVLAMMLTACNGNGVAPGTASNTIMPPVSQGANLFGMGAQRLSPITTYPGAVNGEPGQFRPAQGDNKRGGQGGKVDGIPCDTTEYLDDYHIHVFLGIIYNGKQIAVPDAIGLIHPGPKVNGYIATAGCYYFLHTHDESGIFHIEDKEDLPPTATVHKFKNFLDIWGIKLSQDGLGKLKGSVRAYVGNVPQVGDLTVSKYAKMDVRDLPSLALRSHEAIWIVIGKPEFNAKRMPKVTFYMEY